MKIYAMPNHEYAQCHIVEENDRIYLVSYTTLIVCVRNDGWMDCTGTYSRTTIKHIGWFMRYISQKFGVKVSYYDAKWCYEHDSIVNIFSGEVKTYDEYNQKATA